MPLFFLLRNSSLIPTSSMRATNVCTTASQSIFLLLQAVNSTHVRLLQSRHQNQSDEEFNSWTCNRSGPSPVRFEFPCARGSPDSGRRMDGQGWRRRRRHVGLGARWGGEGEGWGQENTREKTDRFPLAPPLFFTTIPLLKYGIQPPSNSNLSKREKEL